MSKVCVALLLLGSCYSADNPNYCPNNPGSNCENEWDASNTCSSNDQCAPPTDVCDLGGTGTCVECTATQTSACNGTTPVCGDDHACTRCTEHAQCEASGVCMSDGSCGDASQIAYVSASGSGTACTKGAPCPLLKDALAKNLPTVKIAADGAANDTASVVIDGKTVAIVAERGAKLDRNNDGPVLEVRSANANVTIADLEITGASGASGADGILVTPNGGAPKLTLTRVKVTANQGIGINSQGGMLTVSQSTIASNQGGGISVGGGSTFSITNSFIYRNGNSTNATVGGASLAGASTSVFSFNTVIDNQIQNSAALSGGVFCDVAGLTASNNIVVRNFVNNDAQRTNSNTSGLCTYPTSKIATTVAGLNFQSPDDSPHDYHLNAGSTAIDQATTATAIGIDVDGQTRPHGAAPDQGADEYQP